MNVCQQLHRSVILGSNTGVVDESVEITHIFKYYGTLVLTG